MKLKVSHDTWGDITYNATPHPDLESLSEKEQQQVTLRLSCHLSCTLNLWNDSDEA